MQIETFIVETVDWLNRRVAPDGMVVDADTRLFESGIVDSLGILRLIAWTEQAIGREIQDREIRMDRFGSVREMAAHFVATRTLAPCRNARRAPSACAACGRCSRRAA